MKVTNETLYEIRTPGKNTIHIEVEHRKEGINQSFQQMGCAIFRVYVGAGADTLLRETTALYGNAYVQAIEQTIAFAERCAQQGG